MTRPPHDVRSLARRHTASVIDVLVAVAESSEVAPAARVSAAIAILDRGWGKPTPADEKTADVLEDATDQELRDLLQALRDDRSDTAVGDDQLSAECHVEGKDSNREIPRDGPQARGGPLAEPV
jgi:hypothetical protein